MKIKEKIPVSGIRLAALAATGTYLLYGKLRAKNREKISDWVLQLKGEVIERAKKINDCDRAIHEQIIDELAEPLCAGKAGQRL